MRKLYLLMMLLLVSAAYAATPNPGHDASRIGPGTFSVGNFTFNGSLGISGGLTATGIVNLSGLSTSITDESMPLIMRNSGNVLEVDTVLAWNTNHNKLLIDNGATGIGVTVNEIRTVYSGNNLSLATPNFNPGIYLTDNTLRVGISTFTPSQKLDVNGSINISNASAALYSPQICLNGDCRTSWPSISGISTASGWTNTTTQTTTTLNVGIGTTAPTAALHVNSSSLIGSIKVENTTGNVHFFVNGTSGRVGIGTNDPAAQLHVYHPTVTATARVQGANAIFNALNDVNASARFVVFSSNNGGSLAGVAIANWSSLDYGGSGMIVGTTATGAPLVFQSASTEIMRLSSGRVGVGTINPSQLLHVNATSNPYVLIDQHSAAAGAFGLNLSYQGSTKAALTANTVTGEVQMGAVAAGYFPTLYSNGAEAMRITTGGLVGIGTTNPGQELHVTGEVIVNSSQNDSGGPVPAININGAWIMIGDQQVSRTMANGIGIKFHDSGVAHASIKYATASDRMDFCGSSANSVVNCSGTPTLSLLSLNSNPGTVGIGDSTPTNTLDVTGSIGISDMTVIDASRNVVNVLTVDTGQGANELYDMDQNVLTTSSPTFAGITSTGTITGTAAVGMDLSNAAAVLRLASSNALSISGSNLVVGGGFSGTTIGVGHLIPANDGIQDLGNSSRRWGDAYFEWNSGIWVRTTGGMKRAVYGDSGASYLWYDVDAAGARFDGGISVGAAAPGAAGTLTTTSNINSGASVSAAAGSYLAWTGRSHMSSPSDGVILLTNGGITDFARLQFGGTSSSFPALRRSGANLDVVTADAGAWSRIQVSGVTMQSGEYLYLDGGSNTGIRESAGDRISIVTGGTERMAIDSSGYTGIGTGSPDRRLHISGTTRMASGTANLVTNGHFTGNINGWTDSSGPVGQITANSNMLRLDGVVDYGRADQSLTFVAGTTYIVTAQVVTIDPGERVDLYVGTSPGGTQYLNEQMSSAGTYTYAFTATGTSGGIRIETGWNGLDVDNVYIFPVAAYIEGRVGIGDSTPDSKLDIVNTEFDGDVLQLEDSDGVCEGNPGSGGMAWSCSSDERLKKDIVTEASSLDYLLDLPLYEYTVIKSNKRTVGPVAQRMNEVHPELVQVGDDGLLRVSEVTSWQLVRGIQELNEKIERGGGNGNTKQLEDRIAQLEQELAAQNETQGIAKEGNDVVILLGGGQQ